jgi:NAD(P)-dependent dehydrogenase (short-subunit alcohol dehydrogenase family)
VLLADANEQVLDEASASLKHASYNVETQLVDITSKPSVRALADTAAALGNVSQVINTAGLSPNMALPQKILEVDLYGVAPVFDEFDCVIAPRGGAIMISSMAGHVLARLPPKQKHALAFTPADELLAWPFLGSDAVRDSMAAYGLTKS